MRSRFPLTLLCVINAGIPPLISQRLPLRSLYERIRSVLLDLPTVLTRLRDRRGVLPEFRAFHFIIGLSDGFKTDWGYFRLSHGGAKLRNVGDLHLLAAVYATGISPMATRLRPLSDSGVRRRSVWHPWQAQDVFRFGCLKSLFLIQRCLLWGLLREF